MLGIPICGHLTPNLKPYMDYFCVACNKNGQPNFTIRRKWDLRLLNCNLGKFFFTTKITKQALRTELNRLLYYAIYMLVRSYCKSATDIHSGVTLLSWLRLLTISQHKYNFKYISDTGTSGYTRCLYRKHENLRKTLMDETTWGRRCK